MNYIIKMNLKTLGNVLKSKLLLLSVSKYPLNLMRLSLYVQNRGILNFSPGVFLFNLHWLLKLLE